MGAKEKIHIKATQIGICDVDAVVAHLEAKSAGCEDETMTR